MVTKKKPMKKKGMARGGAMKKKGMARGGAKMPMSKDPKTGKMIPAFAMDGKGRMAKGGMTKKKKGYAKGGVSPGAMGGKTKPKVNPKFKPKNKMERDIQNILERLLGLPAKDDPNRA
jgi:hypothetical protein